VSASAGMTLASSATHSHTFNRIASATVSVLSTVTRVMAYSTRTSSVGMTLQALVTLPTLHKRLLKIFLQAMSYLGIFVGTQHRDVTVDIEAKPYYNITIYQEDN
jgi:hypothetical protein